MALCTAACTLPPAGPAFERGALDGIDAVLGQAAASGALPGAVFHLERAGRVHARAYGRLSHEAGAAAVTLDTVYDAASLTKVLATAPSVLLLAEEGRIDLDAPLSAYLPECASLPVTVAQLLTHTSGLPSGLTRAPWEGEAAALALACAMQPAPAPGTAFRYSDVNFILLGLLVQRVSGQPLAQFAATRLFAPLHMDHTGFLPLERMDPAAIAPTAVGQRGVVHDPSARRLGGVAGSAGVFSTAADIARFARMLLDGGRAGGVRILGPDSVRRLSTVQTPPAIAEQRSMGMDIASPFARPRGERFASDSFGHTGFTGCFLWIDPHSRTIVVLLSNRVYPDERSDILPLYGVLGTLAAQAAGVPAPP